jgi:hypothetical protein
MRLDVVYQCQSCGAVSADSGQMGTSPTRFDHAPICGCDQRDVVSFMELHTRDEAHL